MADIITSDEYDRYYQQLNNFMGDKLKIEDLKEMAKSFIINDGISQSAFGSAWKGQALAFGAWLAGTICPFLLPITLPLSFKAGTMIGESDVKVSIINEQQKLCNLESILKQILNKVCFDRERIANTNSLLIVFDDRSDVRTNSGGVLECLASVFVPTVYTQKENRGADVEFRCIKNLKNAPKMIDYQRGGKNLFHIYEQVIQRLMDNPNDMPTLVYIRNYLRNGTTSPERVISKLLIEEKKIKNNLLKKLKRRQTVSFFYEQKINIRVITFQNNTYNKKFIL